MSLESEVIDRIAAERLRQLTNPGEPATTVLNTAKLAKAATDAKSQFKRYVGLDFDETNPIHIEAGIDGVVCNLFRRAGSITAAPDLGECARWQEALSPNGLRAQIGGGYHDGPSTSAVQTPTPDDPEVKPTFDQTFFDDMIPGARSTDPSRREP